MCCEVTEKNKKRFDNKKNNKKKTTTGAKIGKKRKTVAHSQEHQSAVLLCDLLCSSLVPCCPLILVTFLVPSYNCANTIFRPATRTSTLDISSALLSVSDLCATYTYIFCAIPSSTFLSSRTGPPLQSRPRSTCYHTDHRLLLTVLVRTL